MRKKKLKVWKRLIYVKLEKKENLFYNRVRKILINLCVQTASATGQFFVGSLWFDRSCCLTIRFVLELCRHSGTRPARSIPPHHTSPCSLKLSQNKNAKQQAKKAKFYTKPINETFEMSNLGTILLGFFISTNSRGKIIE